jgi:hypothetical protein
MAFEYEDKDYGFSPGDDYIGDYEALDDLCEHLHDLSRASAYLSALPKKSHCEVNP